MITEVASMDNCLESTLDDPGIHGQVMGRFMELAEMKYNKCRQF